MLMIIHHREPADGYREDLRKFFQPLLDPFFTVERSFDFAEQKRAADTPRDAVILARDGDVDQMRASHRHGMISLVDRRKPPESAGHVDCAMRVLAFWQ